MTFLDEKEQANRFKLIRPKLKMSAVEMAESMGCARTYLYSLENGNSRLSFSVLELVFKLFFEKTQKHLNLHWLLLGIGDMEIPDVELQTDERLLNQIQELEGKNRELSEQNGRLSEQNEKLLEQNEALRQQVSDLRDQVATLKEMVELLKARS